VQEQLIARVRELCAGDDRLVAALIYGSFVTGEADEHSDIEFWLFFSSALPDPRAWLKMIGPIRHVVVNEFGSHVVFFPGLIRGEFHFATAAEIGSVATWPARGAATERMIVTDRSGALRTALDSLPAQPVLPDAAELCGRFANWLVLAYRVARRGELLRAVDALAHVQRHLLWMARLAEGRTGHWLTPSRAAETDLPAEVVAAVHRATAAADPDALAAAIAAAWSCGRGYWTRLVDPAPAGLFTELDRLLRCPG
jgi:lincosamide nucleotidyltransferase